MIDYLSALKRVKQVQPILNASITIVEDDVTPSADGPLANVGVAIKDNVCTKDILTTGGSAILSNYIPPYDATIITKLKAAGAKIVSKTALDELGMGGTGTTCFTGVVKNPYNQDHQAGGSSAGSAALVGANAVSVAIGTDTGDSIRKPASFCGVVGVKPTYGRVSRYGVIPYASSLDHVGAFSSSVSEAALITSIISGYDPKDGTTTTIEVGDYHKHLNKDLTGKRIGIFKNVIDHIDQPETISMFHDLMNKAKAAGATIVEISCNEDYLKAILPTYYIIANGEATANHSNLTGVNFGVASKFDDLEAIMTSARTDGFNPLLRKRFVIGSYALKDENQELLYRKAQKVRRVIVEDFAKAMANIDVLVAPASAFIAPKLYDNTVDQLSGKHLISENYMVLGNFSGYPSMTIPMGYIQQMPIGINMHAHPFNEQMMFDIAYGLESLTGLAHASAKVAYE